MKLCSLYIENFGCLSGVTLDFETGMTAIIRPNGFGKTTLAEFIRAMFYGFPRKTKALEKSKRQKYTPWGGGTFGGNLVFEYEGKRYRVERTFGSTPKGDTFALIDLETNRKSPRFSDEIGMELFGLDSDSFERSVYLPQMQETDTLNTAAIQAKLTDLVEDSSDVGSFDKTISLLKAKRTALMPYRGSGGAVAEAAAQITQLQLQLDRAQHSFERWQKLQISAADRAQEQENTKRELAQLQQKLAEASQTAAQMVERDRYERVRQECEKLDAQIGALNAGYPAGFPEPAQLAEAETKADNLAALENQTVPVDAAICHLTEEMLDDCRRSCEEYGILQQKVRAAEASLAEQMQKERQLHAVPQEQTGSAAIVFAWIAAVLGIGAGIALMVAKQLLFGGIGLAIGAIAMIAAILLHRRRIKKQRALALRRQQESDRRMADAQQHVAQLRLHCDRYGDRIVQFFAEFGMDVPPPQFLAGLARLEHQLHLLKENKKKQTQILQIRAELETFFAHYGRKLQPAPRSQLWQLRSDLQRMQNLAARKQEFAGYLKQLEQKYPGISAWPVVAAEDLLSLRREEQRLRAADTSLTETRLQQKQELQRLQEETAQIPVLQEELARLQSQMAEDREKVRILDETMDLLQQARERLSTNYMDTIRARFAFYMAQLETAAAETCLIDTDFQVYPQRLGQTRELAYFSAGQTDLVMLCMRLALVDALFKAEDMFVILDDPFVNLDDVHTAQACALLRKLAAKRQILYLTCHSSRGA